MPSPNIMAAALARRTSRANLVVLGNSIALYNPPIRVAEEFAMLDVLSGGRLVAGFPVGTSMDTNFCYGQTPALAAREVPGSARPHHQGVDRRGHVQLQRQVHAVALRQFVAAPVAAAASSGLDSRRRFDRDLGVLRQTRLPVFIPFLHRPPHGKRITDGYWD